MQKHDSLHHQNGHSRSKTSAHLLSSRFSFPWSNYDQEKNHTILQIQASTHQINRERMPIGHLEISSDTKSPILHSWYPHMAGQPALCCQRASLGSRQFEMCWRRGACAGAFQSQRRQLRTTRAPENLRFFVAGTKSQFGWLKHAKPNQNHCFCGVLVVPVGKFC